MEHFDHSNVLLLSTCYEKILKKDPTCCHSLGKLVHMHRNGMLTAENSLLYELLDLKESYKFEILR